MEYSLEYIRNYMNELDEITGFNSKDIKLSISKRMTNTYAYNQMRWDNPKDKGNRILLNNKMVYSEALLNCGASEEQIKNIIKHEYCHAWADYGGHIGFGHKGKFIECCKKLRCHSSSTNYDEKLNNLHNEYLNNKTRIKTNNNFSYRKMFNDLISTIKYKNENNIRINTKINKDIVQVFLSISERFPDCRDLDFLFDNTVKDIKQLLETNKDIELNNIIFTTTKSGRKVSINYNHYNIKSLQS